MVSFGKASLIKNWSYLLASDITQQIVGFFSFIILARKLAPEGYGQFSVIGSLVAIVAMFANSGMNQVITREITLNPDDTRRIISLIIPIRITSFLISIIGFLIYANISIHRDISTILFVTILTLNLVLWDIAESIAFGHFITKYSSFLNSTVSILWLLTLLVIPPRYIKIEIVLLTLSFLQFMKSVCYMILIKIKLLNNKKEAQTKLVNRKKIITMSLPYLWMRSTGILVDQIPILILNSISGAKEVGYFSIGNRLIIPLTLALSTALRAMFPFMTKLFSEDKETFSQRIEEGIGAIICFGSITALAASISSKYWIPLLLGHAYIESVPAFNFLIWFGVVLAIDLLLSASLSSSYQQNALALLTTIDVIIAVPIYYWGAMHGAWGFSLAKLIFGLVVLTYHWVVFVTLLKVRMKRKQITLLLILLFLSMAIGVSDIGFICQLLLSCILLGSVFVQKDSPLKQSYQLVAKLLFSKA